MCAMVVVTDHRRRGRAILNDRRNDTVNQDGRRMVIDDRRGIMAMVVVDRLHGGPVMIDRLRDVRLMMVVIVVVTVAPTVVCGVRAAGINHHRNQHRSEQYKCRF